MKIYFIFCTCFFYSVVLAQEDTCSEVKYALNKCTESPDNKAFKNFNIVDLLFAASEGDLETVKKHHQSGLDMNLGDYDRRTALHLAASEGKLECVEYLLKEAKVSSKPLDRWGYQPIDDAKRYSHTEVINFLEKWMAENPE